MSNSNNIERHSAGVRANHWVTAICFILMTVSGLSLFHPAFFWLSNVLGGGVWTRILHPFIGVVMFVSFFVFAVRMLSDNLMTANDWKWLGGLKKIISNDEEGLPEVGKYNAGQKLMFWSIVVGMLGLLLTGIVMWRAYFSIYFPIPVIRVAAVLHALFALILICGIIVHIYAAIWVKGTVHAMVRGDVTPGWAYKHHRAWFRQARKGS